MRVAPQWANRTRLSEHRDLEFVRRLRGSFRPWTLDDLVCWLVSDDLSATHADTDQVTGWRSRVGSSVGETNTDSGHTFHTDELNGYPSVRTTGSGGEALITFEDTLRGSSTPTLFLVCKPAAVADNGVISIGNNAIDGGVLRITSEVAVRVTGGNTIFDTALSTTNYQLLTLRMTAANGNSAEAWIDGTALGVSSSGSQATDYKHMMVLGGGFNSSEGDELERETAVDFVEAVVVDAQVSDTLRQIVESYLLTKYGL